MNEKSCAGTCEPMCAWCNARADEAAQDRNDEYGEEMCDSSAHQERRRVKNEKAREAKDVSEMHARLDTDGTARPKTQIIAHYPVTNNCIGPGSEESYSVVRVRDEAPPACTLVNAGKKPVEVIVSRCVYDDRAQSWRVYGEELHRQTYPSFEEARQVGSAAKGESISVIVRPTYNESDAEGNYFREWRSYNGAEFVECKWRF